VEIQIIMRPQAFLKEFVPLHDVDILRILLITPVVVKKFLWNFIEGLAVSLATNIRFYDDMQIFNRIFTIAR